MIPLFLGLTLANVTALLATIALGYAGTAATGALRSWHMLAGTMAALLCIAVHCVVFTYFIATAKWIQHAVSVKGLDAAYSAPTRSFKAQAFPAALGAMAVVFLTAIFGAATDNQMVSATWHHLLALTAFAVNLAAAAIEYNAISHNGRLIDQILADVPPGETAPRVV
jgi:hypothetical protein